MNTPAVRPAPLSSILIFCDAGRSRCGKLGQWTTLAGPQQRSGLISRSASELVRSVFRSASGSAGPDRTILVPVHLRNEIGRSAGLGGSCSDTSPARTSHTSASDRSDTSQTYFSSPAVNQSSQQGSQFPAPQDWQLEGPGMTRSSSAPDLRLLVQLPPQVPAAVTGAAVSPWQTASASSYSGALVPYKGIEVQFNGYQMLTHRALFPVAFLFADVPADAGRYALLREHARPVACLLVSSQAHASGACASCLHKAVN